MKERLRLCWGDTMIGTINGVAVVVAALASMVIGMCWYSEKGFGKQWMKLVGINKKELEAAKKKGMAGTMAVAFLAQLVTAIVLAIIVSVFAPGSALEGARVGFFVWIGFVGTKSLSSVLWENKPKELWILNNGHDLLALLVMGAILAAM